MIKIIDYILYGFQMGFILIAANMLNGRSYKEINIKILVGFMFAAIMSNILKNSSDSSVMDATAYLLMNMLSMIAISQVCKTDVLMSLSLYLVVSLLPAPLLIIASVIGNHLQIIQNNPDLFSMIFGIVLTIGVILFIIIFSKALPIKIQYKIRTLIFRGRHILSFLVLLLTVTTMYSISSSSNYSELAVTDFRLGSWVSMILIVTLIYINIIGKKSKQTILLQYKKINEQQKAIYSYFENVTHLKHDYINILLALRGVIHTENHDDVAVQLDKIEAYALEVMHGKNYYN